MAVDPSAPTPSPGQANHAEEWANGAHTTASLCAAALGLFIQTGPPSGSPGGDPTGTFAPYPGTGSASDYTYPGAVPDFTPPPPGVAALDLGAGRLTLSTAGLDPAALLALVGQEWRLRVSLALVAGTSPVESAADITAAADPFHIYLNVTWVHPCS